MLVVRDPWMKSTKMQVWRVAVAGLGLHWASVSNPVSATVNELDCAPELGLAETDGWVCPLAAGDSTRAAMAASMAAVRPRQGLNVVDTTAEAMWGAAAGASDSALACHDPSRRAERDEVAPTAPFSWREGKPRRGQAVEGVRQPIADPLEGGVVPIEALDLGWPVGAEIAVAR